MKLFHHRGKADVIRLVLITLVGAGLLWLSSSRLPDAALSPLLTSTALVLFVAAVSHLTRRILFPHVDLQVFAQRALDSPIAAAIVFSAVVWLLGTLIGVSVGLLR
jgi:hypothetical protein